MAVSTRGSLSALISSQKLVGDRRRLRASIAGIQPLLAPCAAAWLAYLALGVLLHSPALRVYEAGSLQELDFLRNAAYAFVPDALLRAPRGSLLGLGVLALYLVLATAALASWAWAVRTARAIDVRRVGPLLLLTTLLAVPVLGFVGLFSDDVYLYNLYGRTIDAYGANPIVHPPTAFPDDPHLQQTYWKHLPSSYGPVWLMFSAMLSGAAGDSLTGVIVSYRLGSLALHLLTAAAVWFLLRRTHPGEAAAGTLFYAWNPLVMIEVVANAHNDVLVALFAVLLVAAASHRAWSSAAFFGACAVMVKPFSVLLLPGLALRLLRTERGRPRILRFAAAAAIGLLSLLLLGLPLWAGTTLLANISGNPASYVYTNTVWELISHIGPAWLGVPTVAIQHPYLDAVRAAILLVGTAWILTRGWALRSVVSLTLPLWVLFLLTASWVWPWYFVPAIALAALTRGTGRALAAALSAGGLFFWVTWPPPAAFDILHDGRSILLFGPVLAAIASARVRVAILSALGATGHTVPAPVPPQLEPLRAPSSAPTRPSSATAS